VPADALREREPPATAYGGEQSPRSKSTARFLLPEAGRLAPNCVLPQTAV